MRYIEASEVAALIGKMRPDSTLDSHGFENEASICQWCHAVRDGTMWHFADLPHTEDCALVAFCTRHGMPLPGLPAFDPDAAR